MPDVDVVSAELEARLAEGPWTPAPAVAPATEVAAFALSLSGKRRQARRAGRLGRLIARFALAACLALASVSAACEKPDASDEEAAQAIQVMPYASASEASITQSPRASPAWFTDLLLVDAGSDSQPWATFVPSGGGDAPILVDHVGSGADQVGTVYRIAAQPVKVGTRDGTSQFLDPLIAAESTGSGDASQGKATVARWQEDERYLAPTRAIAGQPTVLDAAYNAEAAATAGGTHTYLNGVVLRVEGDKPVLQMIDRALLESGKPTRAEDVVYVAIRPEEQSLYTPGQVANLRDVVMDAQKTDVDGQATTMYIVNAALEGARVEPTGATVDLQGLLAPRLQQLDSDLAAQAQESGSQPQAAATPGATVIVQQPVVVNRHNSFVPDFLLWMWLTNSGFFSRGPTVIVNNPPPSSNRSGDIYYSPTTSSGGSSPTTTQSAQTDARNTAIQAARSAVSGQSSGSGGGVAATAKSASETSARTSAATAKAAVVAGAVSAASNGKSISSAPSSSSSTASRSAGSISAGTRGSVGSSSGSTSIGRPSSGSSGGFGGKGVGSSSSS
ncbi:MAG TPA: hypothetical protein VFG86_15495 [Chloroflexota bacterium]|nr:hypothetical protein [Chloroflexota bacterium]